MKRNQKFFAYFDNESKLVPHWIIIDEEEKNKLLSKKQAYFFKEVPKPEFHINQVVYAFNSDVDYWYNKTTIIGYVPIFNNSGFSSYYFQTNLTSNLYSTEDLYKSKFKVIAKIVSSLFKRIKHILSK